MSLKIRLSKIGSKGKPIYRIVVMPARSKRDGKNLDVLGFYNPGQSPLVKIDQKRYQEWLERGAKPSEGLRKILQSNERST
mgnify:CR=1 FL=1